MTYKPLPDELTIMPSKIDGLGLFAIKKIKANKSLGLTHVYLPGEENNYLRTPLGGFINHSENPNCGIYKVGDRSYLVPEQDIEPLEELTVKYTLYNVEEE